MTESEINALQIEDVVETSEVIEKPKKTSAKKTTKKEVKAEEPATKTGVVSGCGFLRIRKEAVVADNVVKEIKEGTEVEIIAEAENGFYQIKTKDGDEGFCMAEYIRR